MSLEPIGNAAKALASAGTTAILLALIIILWLDYQAVSQRLYDIQIQYGQILDRTTRQECVIITTRPDSIYNPPAEQNR